MSHTPGPWRWDISRFGEGWVYCVAYEAQTNIIIAKVQDDVPESLANANLIAAAPELLAACEVIQFELEARSLGAYIGLNAKNRIDAAIAKAKGEVRS